VANISTEKIANFVALANARRGFPLSKETSAEQVLTHLKMIQEGKICNSALLAFGSDPRYYFPTAIVKCAYFLGTRWEKPIEDHKVFQGDVFEQVNAAVSFVMSKLSTAVGLREESAQAPIKNEIPRPVIFEAIVNAVVHRDYRSNGSVQNGVRRPNRCV
jgi:predicted HTH transcriptional regulator